jgi:3-methyl-2-oxobutanoate hydroxymethyltransferase
MSADTPSKLSITAIGDMMRRGERLTSVTAYDYPSGQLADSAGIDIVLVGDSAAMTMLGYDSTLPISVDEMLTFTRAVVRGVRRAVVVADMPFGSFQVSNESAVANAVRFAREAGADAVKIEGAGPSLDRARAIVDAGVPVMGHIGLTPQSVTKLGGYRAQGRTAAAAQHLVEDAKALEDAGCFAIVLEAMPAVVASSITAAVQIPTIGIGAGPGCTGQVLVWHDLLGLSAGHVPKFVKAYASLGDDIRAALQRYVADVQHGTFPAPEHTYPMPEDERERFEQQHDKPSPRIAKATKTTRVL